MKRFLVTVVALAALLLWAPQAAAADAPGEDGVTVQTLHAPAVAAAELVAGAFVLAIVAPAAAGTNVILGARRSAAPFFGIRAPRANLDPKSHYGYSAPPPLCERRGAGI